MQQKPQKFILKTYKYVRVKWEIFKMNEKKKKHCSIFKANKIKQYGCKIIENLRIVRKI